MTFVIDVDNNVMAYTNASAPKGSELKLAEQSFGSEKELAALAATWPGTRLVEIWNSLPGATPLKKFTDRKKAVGRIWKAIQSLVPTPEATPVEPPPPTTKKAGSAAHTPKRAKVAKEKLVRATKAKKADKRATARDGSKKARILDLLRQPNGATLAELMADSRPSLPFVDLCPHHLFT